MDFVSYIVYKIPYRRARAQPLGRVRARAKESCIQCLTIRQARYQARHESGGLARVSSLTAVYEFRLTTAYVTGLVDGCYACALVEESRARRLTGWKYFSSLLVI